MSKEFYSLKAIKKQKDLRGKVPRVLYIVGNRTSGKTTSVLVELMKSAMGGKEADTGRFGLLYRTQYEQDGVGEMFGDVITIMKNEEELAESDSVITTVKHLRGLYHEIYYGDTLVGYSASISSVDKLKKYSAAFRGVTNFFMDEFITESGRYLPNEPEKLLSVIMSMSRGQGDRMRDVTLYMCANNISLLNPYFAGLDVFGRLRPETHYLRGDGWIIEFAWDKNAAEEVKTNPLIRAFAGLTGYGDYLTGERFMIDDSSFIEQITGRSRYICTFDSDGKSYGVRDCYEAGYYHVSRKTDPSCPYVYAVHPADHSQTKSMLSHATSLWRGIREAYERGELRFQDAECKSFTYDLLCIDMYKKSS